MPYRGAFIFGIWLIGRLLVLAGFVGVPHSGIGDWAHWDGMFYRELTTRGYEFTPDGWLHDIAFFPLYPALVWCVMHTGIGFDAAGALVNNSCFLGALFVVYSWLSDRYSERTARWSIAVLGLFPLSLFGSVTYSEGMYLLLTALCFRDLDRKPIASAFWSALASLTRPNGFFLMPALLIAAIIDRRPSRLLPAFGAAVGMTAMTLYSAWRFGDPLAFFHAQAAWRLNGYEGGYINGKFSYPAARLCSDIGFFNCSRSPS